MTGIWRGLQSCGTEPFTSAIWFYLWVESVRTELNSQTLCWHLRVACWCGEAPPRHTHTQLRSGLGILLTLVFNVVPGPAALTSPGNLLKMWILETDLIHTEWEILRPHGTQCLNKPTWWFGCILKLKHIPPGPLPLSQFSNWLSLVPEWFQQLPKWFPSLQVCSPEICRSQNHVSETQIEPCYVVFKSAWNFQLLCLVPK